MLQNILLAGKIMFIASVPLVIIVAYISETYPKIDKKIKKFVSRHNKIITILAIIYFIWAWIGVIGSIFF